MTELKKYIPIRALQGPTTFGSLQTPVYVDSKQAELINAVKNPGKGGGTRDIQGAAWGPWAPQAPLGVHRWGLHATLNIVFPLFIGAKGCRSELFKVR